MDQENDIRQVKDVLQEILTELEYLEGQVVLISQQVNTVHTPSAKNLLHYLAFRRKDLRDIQQILARNGLSSLGRSEAFIKNSLENILQLAESCRPSKNTSSLTMKEADAIQEANLNNLLGPSPAGRKVRIMVTLGKEAALDENLPIKLLRSGMDCVRINCAHDDRETWSKIIHNTRMASNAAGLPCKILMDIAGPKIRTGKLKEGPKVVKIKPTRDALGNVLEPAIIGLSSNPFTIRNNIPIFQIDSTFEQRISPGIYLRFRDVRGRKRKLKVREKDEEGNWISLCKRTSYITPGAKLKLFHIKDKITTPIGDIPGIEAPIILNKGDTLLLYKAEIPGEPAQKDESGNMLKPAGISCTNPAIFKDVEVGKQVLFDDGKFAGVISASGPEVLSVTITEASEKGSILRSDKGINFPDTALQSVETFSEKDNEDLKFIAKNADIVNMSFINTAEDVDLLLEKLKALDATDLGVMIKIETRSAIKNLAEIIFTLLKAEKPGMMIARGDLAIEAGWSRLAEVQEELLWLAEAAHLPVVWATQVLESVAKKGLPSRAEITDAAMSQRADCVMLNKGPYITRAVQMLDDILKRMKDHQKKKTPMLRQLALAEDFFKRHQQDT